MRTAQDDLSRTFFALADPTRRAILTRLAGGAATVKELSAPFRMSGPAVWRTSQRGRAAQWRPRTLEAKPLREAAAFTDEFRRFWDESYARLDAYLEHLKAEEESDDERS